jgi:multidrug efflux pump subunit AcrB
MWAAGFSMNNLSLFGLVLAIGIVVDDAIVVVENVQRWIDQGVNPREAAFKAMEEVTPAVIAIAFGLSAVFIPVAFISGISGQFYRQFALTIAFSTLLSAFNSLTLSPALAALLLQPKSAKPDWFARVLNVTVGWFFRIFNRAEGRRTTDTSSSSDACGSASSRLLYVGLLWVTYAASSVPDWISFQPGPGYLIVNLQMLDAATIERVPRGDGSALRTGRSETNGVHHTIGIAGVFGPGRREFVGRGNDLPALLAFEEREGGSSRPGDRAAFVARIQPGAGWVGAGIPAAARSWHREPWVQAEIQDAPARTSLQELQTVVDDLIAEARKHPEVQGLFTSFRANVPQLYANLDRTKAKQQKVAVTDAFQALQVYLGSFYINDFNYLGRTYRVVAQADAPFRARAEDVRQLKTRNAAGAMVPLGAVMDLKDITGPDRIKPLQPLQRCRR